jgi:hypothetical protein
MFDTRTVKTNSNNSNNLNQNSDTEFFKLKSELLLNYPVREETLNALEVQIGFDLGFNNITAQQILLEMEAYFISNNMDNKTINEKIIKDVLIECVGKLIKKSEKDKAKKRPQVNRNFAAIETNIKNPNNMNNLTQNNLVSSNINETATQILNEINYVTVSKKEIAIENYSTFSEKSHLHPTILNSREISYSFFSNFEIKEYSILPKDEETYMEEYKNYFKMAKAVFMESLKIEADDPLMDADKFILLVTFENTEGKPLITDIVLVDPLQDYKKFFLKIENESCLNDYYFFSGQLIYVEGLVKNNDLFAQKIVYGMPILEYGISEPYVRGFFQESAPYLIYALNGPILNKNDIDFGLFIATLRNLANDDPHALILSGPILNIENAAISSGDIKFTNNNDENNANYFELFEFFLNKLNEIFFVIYFN